MAKMSRTSSASALNMVSFFVAVLLAGCIPTASTEQGKAEVSGEKVDCKVIHGKKYCFPRKLVYLPGEGGVLLEMPLGALDAACNRSRKLYPFVNVLFSEGHIPTSESTRKIYPKDKIVVFGKNDFLFKNSTEEYNHCYLSSGGEYREICDRTVNWEGVYLSFEYDPQCSGEVREFSKDLEGFLEERRR